ncbi:MAG: lamin tail domain-containing protein [Planctomycetes bacterium]|nr:lamin tail domain-containing protein [Planctomycetota bacterium]
MLLPALFLSVLFGGDKVVINEFAYDDTSTDDREFVELYNPTSKAIDISGWRLEAYDPTTTNPAYVIPANTMLAPGAYYVLGSSLVPNVNQVVGATNLWENDTESILLIDLQGNVVDAVVYESNKGHWTGDHVEGDGVWGNFTSTEGLDSSWSRMRDGFDTNNNRDFRLLPATPGKSNNQPAGVYIDNFDARTSGTNLTDFGGTFKLPRVIDPTVADTYNPNAIVASPQGGNAAIFWDESGGGNHNMLLRDGTCNVVVEAWVYFDTTLRPTAELESWSLGVQGTSGTFYNFPDPSGTLGFTANGNTGVTWTYQVTDTAATLYLVDHNDGGEGAAAKTNRVVIGKLTPTTGWHRLRLEVSGATVTGYFGGSYGSTTTGTKITGTLSAPAEGGVYISYREGVATNANARPFTCDQLSIVPTPFTGKVDTTDGTATKTTRGTPRMGTDGAPVIDNGSFRITGVGLVPAGTSLFGFGLKYTTPFDLSSIGGQAGSFLYINPLLVIGLSADANGDAALPVALPNDPTLKGAFIDMQILDVDPSLPVSLKFGNSRPVRITAG